MLVQLMATIHKIEIVTVNINVRKCLQLLQHTDLKQFGYSQDPSDAQYHSHSVFKLSYTLW